ncbi:MAG: hypothetical protein KatS3mg014_0331 [Actinomycetota bacterium]|nr:MAG: hypothetical protein KatS3mg014_0331 [Actinomycetota bacterium]
MTYSIVARDPATGELGVAVQSHWFAAGIVCWARAGVGAVATQAMALVEHGPLGLELMAGGASAAEALAARLAADPEREHRQVAMVDRHGGVAAHTGSSCIREAGHRLGEGFSCQANMMRRATVWDAMHDAFVAATGDLADRMLAALEAAEAEGGDIRGRQAARVLVVRAEATDRPWEDVLVDLRVDDHPDPLPELRRLLTLQRAYDRLERAEELELAGDVDGALAERRAAMGMVPDNPEIAFWTAVSLAVHDRLDEARAALAVALPADPGWAELLRRLGDQRLMGLAPELASALLS